jgi:hypothetical protein
MSLMITHAISFGARQTHNVPAIPNAHSKASIHAFRTRVKATVAAYLQALETFGIDVDDGIELEMLALIGQRTGSTPSLSLPPGVKSPDVDGVRRAHRMEASRNRQLPPARGRQQVARDEGEIASFAYGSEA